MPTVIKNRLKRDRQAQAAVATGLIAETYPLQCTQSTLTVVDGDFRGGLVYLYAGEVITNFHCHVIANAATITTAQGSLHLASDGVRKAITANITGAPLTNGAGTIVTIPFTAAYTVPADAAYYICLLQDAGTPATLSCGRQATGAGNAIGSGKPRATNTGSLTAVPDPMTATASGAPVWFAVS